MSFRDQWKQLLDRSQVDGNAWAVGMALPGYASADGTGVRPGSARLEIQTRLSESGVRRGLKGLIAAGLLELVAKGTVTQAAEYRLTLSSQTRTPAEYERDVAERQQSRKGVWKGKTCPSQGRAGCETCPSPATCDCPSQGRAGPPEPQTPDQAIREPARHRDGPPIRLVVPEDRGFVGGHAVDALPVGETNPAASWAVLAPADADAPTRTIHREKAAA